MPKFNDSQTLLTAAEAYYFLGYSIIPLLGDVDPARPKIATRSWSVYQHRLATLNEFQDWFSPQGGAAALGIVTGHISRLVVLDFDSPDLFADFRRRFPDLLETHTVQSAGRGLPHLYFHLPPHLHLASHKRVGVDLLSDGRYVVAPPTTINGSAYRITRGGMPRALTAHDIQRLQSFLTDTQSRPSPSYIKEANPSPSSVNGVQETTLFGASMEHSRKYTFYSPSLYTERGLGGEVLSLTSSKLSSCEVNGERAEVRFSASSSTASLGIRQVSNSHNIPLVGAEFIPPAVSTVTSKTASLSTAYRGAGGEDKTAPLPSRAALHGLYIYWRTKGGRNDALFRTALYARDHGMDETQTRRILLSLHISSPLSVNGYQQSELANVADVGSGVRFNESPALRQREAYATIRSAFSRPPRVLSPLSTALERGLGGEVSGLPNTVREALMQRKLTCVVRTLEGLYQAGFRPGRGFTADQAIQSLKGIVGRDSVYNALNALAPNGQPFFPQRSPSALPQASLEAARQKQPLKTKKCFFVTEKNSGIKKRGTKQRRFKFPTVANLCKLLGVETSGSDPLTRDDLTSAHQTRMALQRELIKRRPGEYSRGWMAKRLGVSRRTINTYNRLIPIHSQPTYYETVLSWTNINTLLTDEVLSGSHIETILGKKYPALRSIACNLLAKGTYIRLKQRKGNLYWYGSDDPPPNILPASALSSVGTRHAVSAPHTHTLPASIASPLPLSSVGEGLRPSHTLSSPAPLSVNGEGLGVRFLDTTSSQSHSVGTRHAVSVSSNPSPVSTSLPSCITPSLVYGLSAHEPVKVADGLGWGLPPSPSLGTRHVVSAPHSPRPEGEGLGRGLPPDQQETLAQTIYTRVNQRNDGTTKHLSLKNARKLVRSHTEQHINFALERLSKRTNLANPTGFFVTVLRSTAKCDFL